MAKLVCGLYPGAREQVEHIEVRAGGPVVKDYVTHFLRDDTDMRRSAGCFDEVEAYSLFRVEPYGRVQVFVGSLDWAIQQADECVKQDRRG